MKRGLALAMAVIGSLLAASSARAQEQNLIFATGLPPNMHFAQGVLRPWVERINTAGAGLVHIDLRDGMALATPSNSYERVLDDAIQIGWGSQVYIAGKFRRTEVISLPGLFDNTEVGSVAFWRLYKSGLLDAEYDQIVPLMLVAFSQAEIHLAKPHKPLDSLAGLKLIGTSKQLSQAIALLGGTPISLTTTEIYEAMQRHTVDGVATSWPVFPAFKLGEVSFFHIETGLGGAPGMVFMAKKKFDALSPAARKIIAENSDEAQTRRFGAFMVQVAENIRNGFKSSPQHVIVAPTPEQAKRIHDRLEPMISEWAHTAPDGKKVVDSFRASIAAVKAGH